MIAFAHTATGVAWLVLSVAIAFLVRKLLRDIFR